MTAYGDRVMFGTPATWMEVPRITKKGDSRRSGKQAGHPGDVQNPNFETCCGDVVDGNTRRLSLHGIPFCRENHGLAI